MKLYDTPFKKIPRYTRLGEFSHLTSHNPEMVVNFTGVDAAMASLGVELLRFKKSRLSLEMIDDPGLSIILIMWVSNKTIILVCHLLVFHTYVKLP